MANELRVKFGYLYYDEIPTRIENGDIDVNDIIFTFSFRNK